MTGFNYLIRRGASYSARIRVPLDLVGIVGKKELVKALGTKEQSEAKRLLWPVIEGWNRHFDDLRARRAVTADDKAFAVWQHYEATLQRDEQTRQDMPTQAIIDEATSAVLARASRGEISSADPLAILDATLDVQVLKKAREYDALARRAKLDALRKHLVTGETGLIAHEVEDYAQRNRLLIDDAHPDWNDIARKMMRAEIQGLERTLERDRGDYSGTPKDPIVKPATGTNREVAAPGENIMEVFAIYERENPKQIKPDTLAQARRDIGTFVDCVGSTCPVHRIDKKAVREWKTLLMRYPVKATESKAFEGMKISQIIKHNETVGKPVLSTTTVNRYLSSLGAFCGWLADNGYLDSNPVADMFLAKKKDKTTVPFKVDQLNGLFSSPLFIGCESDEAPRFWSKPGNVLIRDHRYWVPLIMLYSGARPAEIAQLAIDDVREQEGIWFMHITTEGDGDKSVKTEGSMRVVPIHQELVKLGFLKYHADMKQAGQTRLFPQAVRNSRGQMIADFSRDFPRYLAKISLKNGPGLSLYSFRHGATDALRRAGYLDEEFGFILGHTSSTMTQRYGVLPQGMLEQRAALIDSINYPQLNIEHLMNKGA
ncbi:site-specific integrase [Phyllobacterium zundukense]|uniref:Site-specific integrase n=1 Tax=Phyllobacterium zundukense TaxID=1867719 RepID=A0ACD4D7E8_9HYPH|nr:site-specific integrase [Phyllobacterium zundukense]UXN61730.1 site-specific integrase [Phyllobacterium zundukense]